MKFSAQCSGELIINFYHDRIFVVADVRKQMHQR